MGCVVPGKARELSFSPIPVRYFFLDLSPRFRAALSLTACLEQASRVGVTYFYILRVSYYRSVAILGKNP